MYSKIGILYLSFHYQTSLTKHEKPNKVQKKKRLESDSILKSLLGVTSLFVLLTPESGVGVGDLDGQLSCSLHNHFPVLGGDVVGDLSAVSPAGTSGGKG